MIILKNLKIQEIQLFERDQYTEEKQQVILTCCTLG